MAPAVRAAVRDGHTASGAAIGGPGGSPRLAIVAAIRRNASWPPAVRAVIVVVEGVADDRSSHQGNQWQALDIGMYLRAKGYAGVIVRSTEPELKLGGKGIERKVQEEMRKLGVTVSWSAELQ